MPRPRHGLRSPRRRGRRHLGRRRPFRRPPLWKRGGCLLMALPAMMSLAGLISWFII